MFLTAFGALCLTYLLCKLVGHIIVGVKCYAQTQSVDFRALGQWAVVTGATGGIGLEFAKALASRGLNVVLVGRSETALSELKEKMQTDFPSNQFQCLCVDFNEAASDVSMKLTAALGSLDIGVLVNCAGVADTVPGLMHEMDVKLGVRIINVNVTAPFLVSHCVLAGMKRRRRGAIINVSSFAAFNICPNMSCYAASKCYLGFLSKSLAGEYGPHNIKVQCLFPSFVQTSMAARLQDVSKPSVLIPTPEAYVRSALNTFGIADETAGWWFHSFFGWVLFVLPCQLSRLLGDQKMDEMIAYAKKKSGLVANGSTDGKSAAGTNGHTVVANGVGNGKKTD